MSWVIVHKESGEVVLETYDENVVKALNTEKYTAFPIYDYLVNLNERTKETT